MTARKKLTPAELDAWEHFASEAFGLRAIDLERVSSTVLAQHAAADADALLREWRRRAGRLTICALEAERRGRLRSLTRGDS